MKTLRNLALIVMLSLTFSCSNDDGNKSSEPENPIVEVPTENCNVRVTIKRIDTYPNPDVVLETQNIEYYLKDLPTWFTKDGTFFNFRKLHCGESDFYSQMGANYIKIEYYRDATN